MFLLEEESKDLGRMRAQMVEKEKMVAIGQMATGVAHEVSNPLSSISSVVQMLKRNGAGKAPSEQLELIESNIRRISGTVRQLVSLARPGPDQWEEVDLAGTLAEAVQLVRFDRRARNIEIDFEEPTGLPATFAMPGQLQQVFINLALNALDAMEKTGGKLHVWTQARRQEIVVGISDTGCGIEADVGRRIFEPFFTTKEAGRGTGLGLAVSYGIVRKHGGDIEYQSEPGEGTTFTVTLPVLSKPPDASHGETNRTAGG
jgi:signal transduction histidine kinase